MSFLRKEKYVVEFMVNNKWVYDGIYFGEAAEKRVKHIIDNHPESCKCRCSLFQNNTSEVEGE